MTTFSITDVEVTRAACIGCGVEFVPQNARQTRCRHDCGRSNAQKHAARDERRSRHATRFIGVDGEGVGRGSDHRYCLLSVGDKSLYHTDGSQLDVLEIFEFLWQCFLENKDAAFVGYYLDYDFTNWFKTLPGERARMLLTKEGQAKRARRTSGGNPTPFPVEWRGWLFDILNSRRFRLCKEGAKDWLYVCDAGPFFQTSFLNAITKDWKHPIVSVSDLAVIKEGKARRGFATFDADMIRYNVTENKVMADMMAEYNRGLVDVGLRLNKDQWFGPGQAAQEWLKTTQAPTTIVLQETTPFTFRDTARMAYYGGWFEITAHGPIPGPTYEYDINSAYPTVIASLPCLLHGEYTEGTGSIEYDPDCLTLICGEATGRNRWLGGLPYRNAKGVILRPTVTSGWYWQHEVEAAKRAKLVTSFEFEHCYDQEYTWVRYRPCDCPPPMRAIAALYEQRLLVGKNTPQGKALKLVYNSAYGKFAQSIGHPKFGNAVYASLITAGCRTMILDAIATHPKGASDVMMVATDGVYFRSKHNKLETSKTKLGAWDSSTHDNLSLFMPGVYWDNQSRERVRHGDDPVLKSRGISAGDLADVILDIDKQWAWRPNVEATVDDIQVELIWPWPEMSIPVHFDMVSARQALARGNWHEAGYVSDDGVKTLSADPSHKRDTRTVTPVGDILRTRPYAGGINTVFASTPYEPRFGEEMREKQLEQGILTPEGNSLIFAINALQGRA